MFSTLGAVRRTHRLLSLLVAVALAAVGLAMAPSPQAQAGQPAGSPVEIFLERGSASYGADPSLKITDSGWWAHEGPSRSDLETSVSTDLTDGAGTITDASQAAWLAQLGVDDYAGLEGFGHLGVAFAPTSADGSNESPTATPGQSALDLFDWVTDLPFPSSFSPARDDVYTVSTKAEFNAWVADGKPDQQADANLVYHDIFRSGSPVSVAPKGKSLLNRWTAGQDISLVVFQFDSLDANGIPVIGSESIEGGHVVSAWLPFHTVADPSRAVATSGGYEIVNDVVTPTVTLADSWSGSAGTLTATLTGPGGGAALTDATGTVQFTALPAGASSGTYAPYGAPVAVGPNGKASISVTGLAPGEIQKFKATYMPDVAASSKYAEATGGPRTVVRPAAATTTTLTVAGTLVAGATQTLTATVAPSGATGTVTFKDGTQTLGTASVSGGTATKAVKLKVGARTLTASFAPSTGGYEASSDTASVTVAKARATIRTTLRPKPVKVGIRPKLTIAVSATGLRVTGMVKVVVNPPKGATKTLSARLQGGKATVTLLKAVKGSTRVTVKYLGNRSIKPATKSLSYTVK